MGKTHGVLTDGELLFKVGRAYKSRQISRPRDLEEVLWRADTCSIDTIWVQPGANVSYWPDAPDLTPESGWDIRKSTISLKEPAGTFLRNISARQGRTWVSMAWPEHNVYEWTGMKPAGETILTAIDYLAEAFGVQTHQNAGVMGRELMKKLNNSPRRAAWCVKPAFDYDQLPDIAGEGYAYVCGIEKPAKYLAEWMRKRGHKGPVYVHAKDVNSQYPHASGDVQLPCGMPEYHTVDIACYSHLDKPQEKRAGFWHLENLQAEEGSLLVELNPLEDGQEWVSTPLLNLLISEGAQFDLTEAWIWPERHAVLDKFADAFWLGRQALSPEGDAQRFPDLSARGLAYYSAKRMGAACIGLLKSPETKKYNPDWWMPHWWRFIVEQARCKMYFVAKKIYEQFGELPLMIASDAMYYLSTESDPDLLFPGVWRASHLLGGWKGKEDERFPRLATPENLACFDEPTPGMAIVALRKVA